MTTISIGSARHKGADAVMDFSTGADIHTTRELIVRN